MEHSNATRTIYKEQSNGILKRMESDNIPDLLFIQKENSYRGYKKTVLFESVTDFVLDLLSCNECEGLLREACFSQGRNLCAACSDEKTPNMKLQEAVSKLQAKCPLDTRGCEWQGFIPDVLEHTEECGHLLVACTLNCEEIMPRNELDKHVEFNCVLREVACDLCGDIGQAKDRETHEDVCCMLPLDCPQGCGDRVARGRIEEHCVEVCELSEMQCPFSTFGCLDIMSRKHVSGHVESFVTLHQEMMKNMFLKHDETIRQQNEQILDLRKFAECMATRISELEKRNEIQFERVKPLQGVQWQVENLGQLVRTHEMVEGPGFSLGVYTFRCKAAYNPDMRCIHIYVERIDEIVNGICVIQFIKMILVNRDDGRNQIEEMRNTLHQISIGDKLPLINISYPIRDGFIEDDSLLVRMYFDIV